MNGVSKAPYVITASWFSTVANGWDLGKLRTEGHGGCIRHKRLGYWRSPFVPS